MRNSCPDPRHRAGFTMMEVLVAMAILAMLGLALVGFLRAGMATWRIAAGRGEAFARAQAILERMGEDLVSLASDSVRGGPEVRLLSDYDARGRQRLRLVRTIRGESQDPILHDGGLFVGAQGDCDHRGDLYERAFGALRASGGLEEVAYFMDAAPGSTILRRAVRAPIGGAGSVFQDATIVGSPPRLGEALAAGVLYVEWNFWSQYTASWRVDWPARPAAGARKPAGPCAAWDSSRATDAGEPEGFPFARKGAPRAEAIFPSRVGVLLVIEPGWVERYARLTRDVGPEDRTIPVDGTRGRPAAGFVLIDGEWIHYAAAAERAFEKVERGRRGTKKASHKRGTEVRYGLAFHRVIEIPACREDWSEVVP